MAVITIRNLRKYYGNSRGLESASLTVNEGEIYGFIGPNGAGKTTLIRILLGLLRKDSGEATILNQNCHMDQYKLNQSIGYLPSESFFFSEYKVKEIIAFYESIRKVDSNYKESLIDKLDIDIEKKVSDLSFGNKKKLGILIAMMHEPKVLILDEPTTGLDPLIQQHFLNFLLEVKTKGTTIFLSSHVLSDIQKICDKIALIKDGVVVFEDTLENLKQKEHKIVEFSPALSIELKGIKSLNINGSKTSFQFQGNIQSLLAKLSKMDLKDVIIRDVTLEEIFLSYYEKEDHHA